MSFLIKCKVCEKNFVVINSRKETALYCSVKCKVSTNKYKQFGERMRLYVRPWTEERRDKLSKKKLSSGNPLWKGDEAGLQAIHIWVRNRKPKPKHCVLCRKDAPRDLANISQKYLRDVEDFEWLCRRCHMKKDGRLEKLIKCKITCKKTK